METSHSLRSPDAFGASALSLTDELQSLFDAVYAQAAACAAEAEFERSIQLYDRAIALAPARAEPYYKRANVLKSAGRLVDAVTSYDQAIERKPDYAHAYCNRGVVQQSLGRMEEALISYERAITLDPADAVTYYNRALLMQEWSRWDEALESYDHAVAVDPRFADAQYNRSMLQLFMGDFERGWRGYEWRWINAQRLGIGKTREFTEPRWFGQENISGKRILLYGEAGLGDTLQFCRYATLCGRLGATVILEVQAPLRGLLTSLEGVSELVSAGSPLPVFDYQCPLLSLPLAFNTTLDTIPSPSSYLRADEERLAQWRFRLGERHRPRVGLVWSGNSRNPMDSRRSIPLGELLGQLPMGFEYFRLQTEMRESDRVALESNPSIVSFDDDLLDFENTAALCKCMDVIVTIDTSIAHLAGTLGHRAWVLLPHTPDFRWLRDRDDSPWYPSLRLYRQAYRGDWKTVLNRVAADLHREFL
jgi:tetratricopeptide (TPR) repeat protein